MNYLRAAKNLILFLLFGLFYGLRIGLGIWLWCIYTGGWNSGLRRRSELGEDLEDPVDPRADDFDTPSHQ